LDYGLVSDKNLSKKIPSSGWHPWPGNLNQNGLKPTPLTMSPTKNELKNLPISFSLQSRRLAASF